MTTTTTTTTTPTSTPTSTPMPGSTANPMTNLTTVDTRAIPRRANAPTLVLVAEDDPVQRMAIVRALERGGFAVVAAADGAEAIELAETWRPDLAIVDAMMPGLSGFDAINALRARPGLTTTPTIVVSGLEDAESRLSAFAVGADDFVSKPVDHDELLARVRARLRIADAWQDRVSGLISDFRTIRRRISDSPLGGSPAEAARSLMPRFPNELGCSTIVITDRSGNRTWATGPFYPEDLAAADLSNVPLHHGSVVVPVNDRQQCPICGGDTGGSVIAAPAGAWNTGRATLLVGCTRRSSPELRIVAEEVADACGVVLTERLRDWESDLELSNWFESVVASRAFDVHFQPIVDIRSGRVVAQEALARFHDGTSPGHVFQAATALDRRVVLEIELVRLALAQAVALPDGVRVHVNISPRTARTTELARLVSDQRRRVVLEITEDALFGSVDARDLRSAIPPTALLAADDVGMGYAGLSQLLEFRPDVVKIDRSVVTDVDGDPARQALVAGLVQFASAIGASVVGEGVERAEEWCALRALGVDFGQGYFFGRPVPLAEAASLVICP